MQLNHLQYNFNFLRGRGEMAELIRAKEWSKTNIGNPESWPQSLRTTLNIVLNAGFPMFLWWGKDLTCFYNDAYKPILQVNVRPPDILGMKAEEALTETWGQLKPLIDQVLSSGEPVCLEDQLISVYRNGEVEDAYWTFTYNPVNDETGTVAGVLLICTETTEKKKAETKLKTIFKQNEGSEKRLRLLIQQAPLAIGIFRGSNYIVEIINASALLLCGRKEKEVLNRPILVAIPELFSQGIKELLDKVYNTKTSFSAMEFPLQLLRNGTMESLYINFTFQPIIDANGKINGIMAIGFDVTEQAMLRHKIEENEERLNIIINASELATWELNIKTRKVNYSQRYLGMLGYNKDVQLTHQQILAHLHQDDLPVREKAFKEAYKTGILHYETRVIWNNGTIHWIEVKGKIFYDADNNPEKAIGTARDITTEKNHEQELVESEQKFRLLADSIPHQVWTTDPEGKLNYVNQTVYNYSGMTFEEMEINGLMPIVHPDEKEKNLAIWLQAVSTGEIYSFEHRLKKINDDYRWHMCRAVPKKDKDGKIQMWVGTSIDIQEQKMFMVELEKLVQERTIKLEEHNSFIETLLNSTIDSIFVLDTDLRFISLNENAKKSLMAFDNVIGKHAKDIIPHLNETTFWTDLQKALTGETVICPIYKSRKYVRFYEITYVPLKRNNSVYAIMVILHEITERILQEAELRQLNETFALAEETSKIGSFRVRLSTHTVSYSDNLYRLLGCEPQEFEAGATNFFNFVHPDDMEIVKLANERYAQTEDIRSSEFRIIKKNGEIINVRTTGIIITDNDEKYFIGTIQDVTASTFQQNILKNQNKHLEEVNKELQSFTYISSHDLQEPLRKIQTFSNRIVEMEFENLSDTGKDYFQRMNKAAKRMQTLIDDLLAYSRTNNAEKKFELTNLKEIVEEVKEDLREELYQKNGKIEIGKMCIVSVIPFQMRQLLYNLFSNSLKFSKKDCDPIIKIHSEIAKGSHFSNETLVNDLNYCHIAISDNGIGFEPEYNEKIFELFQRLHGRGEYSGTGIGLAIVKKIIGNHNGIIRARGELSKGTIFNIYIPTEN